MERDATPEQVSRACVIGNFLPWTTHETGQYDRAANEGGYNFRRSTSIYGNHEYEVVEDEELAELIIRFLKEDE